MRKLVVFIGIVTGKLAVRLKPFLLPACCPTRLCIYLGCLRFLFCLRLLFLGGEYRDWETDRKSTRLNSSHITRSRMPSSA